MRDPEATLRQHELPVTAQRLAVLRAVSRHPHATADALAESVREDIGAISRQSVYNVLSVLTDNGIIRRIQPADSPARYEDRIGDNHHHLVCRGCGRTVEVEGPAVELWADRVAAEHGFAAVSHTLVIFGTCPACTA